MDNQTQDPVRFAVCVDNSGYPVSLDLHKVYRVLYDSMAEQDGDLRVIDESGEDYLYPATRFVLIDMPQDTARMLERALVPVTSI